MKKILFFILISLSLHLNSYFGLNYAVNKWLSPQAGPSLTVIDIIQEEKPFSTSTKEKQIVKQLDVRPDQILDSNELARFESATRQRVIKETKSVNLGQPSNESHSSSLNSDSVENTARERLEFEDAVLQKQNPFPQNISSRTRGSAFNQQLPNDIDFADATNLNTDANIYYSFYNRVQELFYFRWTQNLNRIWNQTPEDFKTKQLANRNWSTIMEIWLKSNGEFHSAFLLKSSGFEPFDQAPVKAFKDARFFPNPPPAKVEPDGFIRLKYRFTVRVGPYS